jgi:hypothetical protein
MPLKKFVLSTIAIIVALYVTTALSLMINYFLISKDLTFLFNNIDNKVNPLYRDFRYAYLASVIINLPLFLIFSSWGKNNLRKILVPCIIFGFIFIIYQHLAITWASPNVSGMQMLKGFFNGALEYLLFYGSYWLIMRALERIGNRKSENENIL